MHLLSQKAGSPSTLSRWYLARSATLPQLPGKEEGINLEPKWLRTISLSFWVRAINFEVSEIPRLIITPKATLPEATGLP